jgi:hypothetical protein
VHDGLAATTVSSLGFGRGASGKCREKPEAPRPVCALVHGAIQRRQLLVLHLIHYLRRITLEVHKSKFADFLVLPERACREGPRKQRG